MKTIFGLAALALLAVPAAAPPSFHYERPVQLASASAPETCVVLPVELFPHAAPALADLRLMAGTREVAYQLRTSTDAVAERAIPQPILNLGDHAGALAFDVAITEPRYSRLTLHVARGNFSVLVHIAGSNQVGPPDASGKGDAGVSFPEVAWSSAPAQGDAQQTVITLPPSTFPYLHVELRRLALDTLTPQDLTGVDLLSDSTTPPEYVTVAEAEAPEQAPHTTLYRFAVPANVPVERLYFDSDDKQAAFSREATLERLASVATGRRGHPEPEQATEAQGMRIAQTPEPAARVGTSLPPPTTVSGQPEPGAIDVGALAPMPAASTVRLTISNGDDAPLALHGVRLAMRQRRLCFLRRPGEDYVLRYGDPALAAPHYDVTPLQAAQAGASTSTAGEERLLLATAQGDLPFTEQHPYLLWVALFAVVLTLGTIAIRTAARR